MQITKIKIDKKTNLAEISYKVLNLKNTKEVKFFCYEEPKTEFLEAFRDMKRYISSVLKVFNGWEDSITVTGLSITYDDDSGDLMGMVITAQLEIDGLNAPMNINTPFITFDSYEMQKENSCVDVVFNIQCEADLQEIFEYAEDYMNGDTKNKQLKLVS